MNPQSSSQNLDALFQQAITCHQSGRLYEALEAYEQVIGQLRQYVEAFLNAGSLLERFGKMSEALAQYDAAIALQPAIPDSHCLRGNLLFRLQRHDEALSSYDRAIGLRADFPEAFLNRGLLLVCLRRFDEALTSYARAIELRPDYIGAQVNRGQLLKELGRFAEALASYDQALAVAPDSVDALNNRGILLGELRRYDDAIACHQRVIALKPDHAESHVNLGIVLAELGRCDEALACYEKAITLRPDFAMACHNKALLLRELGRFDEAMGSAERALRIAPDYAEAHYLVAELLLLAGKYGPGWERLEWRWKSRYRDAAVLPPASRRWTGAQALAGKCLLIEPEAGYGDQIMLARYVRLIEAQGAEVLVRTSSALRKLFFSLGQTVTVIDEGDEVPPYDYWCPIMSLPHLLGTTVDTIPTHFPYLVSPAASGKAQAERTGVDRVLRVGIAWSGSVDRAQERNPRTARSMPLAVMEPLLRLPAEFHSLQKTLPEADQALFADFPNLIAHQEEFGDFADTAALIESLDLVISVDTAVAHLAGALGKPLWVMLPASTDYRWGGAGEQTPWYPGARLFRQQAAGNWVSVLEQVVLVFQSSLTAVADGSVGS